MPHIHHFFSRRSGKASAVVSQALAIPPQEVLKKLELGAIYVRRRRIKRDEFILQGDYVRVHEMPKRFDVSKIKWAERIIALTEDFVIVDKPHGLPTHETVDNTEENVRVQLSKNLGFPLFVTHRLDQPTGGLLLFARDLRFQKQFNRWLESGRIIKKYEALIEKTVPLGLHTHYMIRSKEIPKKIGFEKTLDSMDCRMVVERCDPDGRHFRASIQLLTGRTHQIRAQMALLGTPILGDSIYGSSKPWAADAIALAATQLAFESHAFHVSLESKCAKFFSV